MPSCFCRWTAELFPRPQCLAVARPELKSTAKRKEVTAWMNTLRPPGIFLLSLAHKVSASFVCGRGGKWVRRRYGGDNKTKTFFIKRRGCFQGVGQLGRLMGVWKSRFLSFFLLLCLCLITATGNIVERGRCPRVPWALIKGSQLIQSGTNVTPRRLAPAFFLNTNWS